MYKKEGKFMARYVKDIVLNKPYKNSQEQLFEVLPQDIPSGNIIGICIAAAGWLLNIILMVAVI